MATKNKTYGLKDLEKRLGKMSVGGLLRTWRLSEGVSQKAFAEQIGITPANLCDIENGRKGVSPAKAHEIAQRIGYSSTVLVKVAIEESLSNAGLDYEVDVRKAI